MSAGIPRKLYRLFWDVRPEDLHKENDAFFIIERLLETGDDAAIRWVLTSYPEETIAHVVRNSRRLSRKTARFWQLFFRLKEEEVRCLSRYYRQVESPFWNY